MQNDRYALLSIYPRYASKILSGEKRLEFRKSWAAGNVKAFVIYATAPVQRIVGIARIKKVHKGSPTALWKLSREIGGGIDRRALYDYFRGKKSGFAIEIDSVMPCLRPVNPEDILPKFNPPQSFNYLDETTFTRINNAIRMCPKRGRVLLVAGVHGVGKTTLCSSLGDEPEFIHKSASQLIRETKEEAIASNTKIVSDVEGNQSLLVGAVNRITNSGKNLLLDGHLTLLNASGKVESIATKVFADLDIDGIILISDKPIRILSRLTRRGETEFSEHKIKALQASERKRANEVSKELGLPLIRVKPFDDAAFEKAVLSLKNKWRFDPRS